MPDVMDEDLQGYGQPAPVAPSPSLGNQDITKGPVMSELPAPYQPPAQTGNWDSSQYISEAFKRLPPDVALKAMEGAIQLEGQLGYAADIKAGVPEMSALSKWAPKMYHRNPAVAARLIQQQTLANKPAFQPSTKEVGGRQLIQTSPNRFQVMPDPTGKGATVRDQVASSNALLRGYEKQMETAMINRDKAGLATLQKKHQQVLDELEDLTKPKKSAEFTRLRNKKTGKTYRHPGEIAAGEIPDDYEVLE